MLQTIFGILMLLMIAGNCQVLADTAPIPNMTGNWTGTSVGHERTGGFTGASEWLFHLIITDQKSRVFNGTLVLQKKDDKQIRIPIGISGAIESDMQTFYLTEEGGGYAKGRIIDPDTLEYIYMVGGENASIAIDTFTRDT
jgi:hypothetical protein